MKLYLFSVSFARSLSLSHSYPSFIDIPFLFKRKLTFHQEISFSLLFINYLPRVHGAFIRITATL